MSEDAYTLAEGVLARNLSDPFWPGLTESDWHADACVLARRVLDDREALATLARAAEAMREIMVDDGYDAYSDTRSLYIDLVSALKLPAVRDVLANNRAAEHSHAARDTGEGEE